MVLGVLCIIDAPTRWTRVAIMASHPLVDHFLFVRTSFLGPYAIKMVRTGGERLTSKVTAPRLSWHIGGKVSPARLPETLALHSHPALKEPAMVHQHTTPLWSGTTRAIQPCSAAAVRATRTPGEAGWLRRSRIGRLVVGVAVLGVLVGCAGQGRDDVSADHAVVMPDSVAPGAVFRIKTVDGWHIRQTWVRATPADAFHEDGPSGDDPVDDPVGAKGPADGSAIGPGDNLTQEWVLVATTDGSPPYAHLGGATEDVLNVETQTLQLAYAPETVAGRYRVCVTVSLVTDDADIREVCDTMTVR